MPTKEEINDLYSTIASLEDEKREISESIASTYSTFHEAHGEGRKSKPYIAGLIKGYKNWKEIQKDRDSFVQTTNVTDSITETLLS